MDKKRIVGQSLHSGFFFGVNFAARFLMAIALGKSLAVSDYGTYILIATVVVMIISILPLDACQYYMREIPGRAPLQAATIFKSIVGVQTIHRTALRGHIHAASADDGRTDLGMRGNAGCPTERKHSARALRRNGLSRGPAA